MAEKCEMIIGYLVPHRCENPSLGACIKCGRGFCDEHTNATKEGRVCLAAGIDSRCIADCRGAFTSTSYLWSLSDNDNDDVEAATCFSI
jgi:hypothetical protein